MHKSFLENFIKTEKENLNITQPSEPSMLIEESGIFSIDTFDAINNIYEISVKNNKNHYCETCGKAFQFLHHLKKHIVVHEGVKNPKCEFCGKKFRQDIDVKRHIDHIHAADKALNLG